MLNNKHGKISLNESTDGSLDRGSEVLTNISEELTEIGGLPLYEVVRDLIVFLAYLEVDDSWRSSNSLSSDYSSRRGSRVLCSTNSFM